MHPDSTAPSSTPVFRIDEFIVPPEAVLRFSAQLHRVNAMVGALPGCRQNRVLMRSDEAGGFRLMTVAEWADAEAFAAARAAMQRHYASEGFDPAAFMKGLGVRADMGTYLPA